MDRCPLCGSRLALPHANNCPMRLDTDPPKEPEMTEKECTHLLDDQVLTADRSIIRCSACGRPPSADEIWLMVRRHLMDKPTSEPARTYRVEVQAHSAGQFELIASKLEMDTTPDRSWSHEDGGFWFIDLPDREITINPAHYASVRVVAED